MKSILENCQAQMVDIMTDYEKTANQIDSIGDELKQIGNSVSNMGRFYINTVPITKDRGG